MIHANIEFHNAAALEPLDGMPGLCPVRYPRAVRERMNARARLYGAHAASLELRWVASAPTVRLTLAAHDNDVTLTVFRGDFVHSEHTLPAGCTRVIVLDAPARFLDVRPEFFEGAIFQPDVWRVQFSGGIVSFLALDGLGKEIRPPHPREKPSLRWLAYGSSITHSQARGYPNLTARRLRVDVLNKGLAGGCHCEAEAADFLAEEDWDFATLELGVNMRGSFTPEEFEKRARYLVRRLRQAKPEAPLVLITHFLNSEHFPAKRNQGEGPSRQDAFDAILRTMAGEDACLSLIEGTEVLSDAGGLSCDLVHPKDYGHMVMAENLARLLQPVIGGLDGQAAATADARTQEFTNS